MLQARPVLLVTHQVPGDQGPWACQQLGAKLETKRQPESQASNRQAPHILKLLAINGVHSVIDHHKSPLACPLHGGQAKAGRERIWHHATQQVLQQCGRLRTWTFLEFASV